MNRPNIPHTEYQLRQAVSSHKKENASRRLKIWMIDTGFVCSHLSNGVTPSSTAAEHGPATEKHEAVIHSIGCLDHVERCCA